MKTFRAFLFSLIAFLSFFLMIQSSLYANNPNNSKTQNLSIGISGIDMSLVEKKLNVLKFYRLPSTSIAFGDFNYSFKVLTNEEFNSQKPADALPFDVGFIASDGTINVSEPITDAQKAVFKDISKAAVYYLCQSYMYFYYQASGLPLLFKIGFPAFETGLDPADAVIKESVNKYGGTFSSFDLLNNSTTFVSNNGWTIAYAFGEFMSAYKNWGYPLILNVTANSFDAASWWFNTENLKGLLDDFNRYLYARFLEPNEALRVKLVQETDNFRIYTRQTDADVNFPELPDALEKAYKEYSENYKVTAGGKLTAFTLSGCADAVIEGISCDPSVSHIGGTAWSSGLHFGCVSDKQSVRDVIGLCRHELGHAFQGFIPAGETTQWLMEGFAFFSDGGPMRPDFSDPVFGPGYWKQTGISSLEKGTIFFGHRPTYEDTKVYPGYETDYGYKYLGYFLEDFIYRKGGYLAVKEVELNDLDGYKKLGYSSGQAIMDDFYFDFDVRVQDKPVVELKTPLSSKELTSAQVDISWTPLKADVKYNILVSTDNKANWNEIASQTTQTSAVWNSGGYSGNFFLKFVAPDNLNLESVFGPFTVTDVTKLALIFPNGGEYLIAEDTVRVTWGTTAISNIKLEYSENNGSSWTQIAANTPTAGNQFKWVVPNVSSSQCKIRISDISNSAKFDTSEKVFTVLDNNSQAGPFLYDNNTMLLLHFDNDLNNRSYYSGAAQGSVDNLYCDQTVSSAYGNCLKVSSPIVVPHSPNLNLTGDWTIEAWVKLNSFNANLGMTILTKPGDINSYESNYTLEVNPWWGNVFHGFYFSGAGSRIGYSSFTPLLDEWYHVAFIRDTKKSEVRLIVTDAAKNICANISTGYSGSNTLTNAKDLIIGSNFDGYIDELRISNIVRYFKTDVEPGVKVSPIKVTPNPTNGLVNIENALGDIDEILIMSLAGQVVYSNKMANGGQMTLDLHYLPKGIYLVKVRGKDKEYQSLQRLVIQ